jgi:Phage tail tube protein
MAKNFASLYASVNDSSSLEQAIFIKEEITRGTLIAPTATDFIYTLAGGSLAYSQPIESSPHRSGRHHNDIIKSKKEMSWTLPIFFNIDETLGAPASTEIDTGVRLLYKSLLGRATLTAGAVFDAVTQPDVTFSLFENGDKWGKQARGCFVDGATLTFPGDGRAQAEFRGMGAEALLVGIGKSVTANATNTVTVGTGEGKRFPVNSLVMIKKADGTTLSTDTPSGSPRTVLSVVGDVVTLSGANLTDADGSVALTPVYLCYYEPPTKTAISNPITGLVGSFSVVSMPDQCVRSATITLENGHEAVNYCYGEDALDGSYFIAANRLTATLSMEINLNDDTVEFYNAVQAFEDQDITLVLGNAAGRHLEITMPKVIFSVPSISVPETGSIPVTYEGICYQSALDAADEITVSFI